MAEVNIRIADLEPVKEVLARLTAVADAARALHLVMDFDDCPEWAALGAALEALDGAG